MSGKLTTGQALVWFVLLVVTVGAAMRYFVRPHFETAMDAIVMLLAALAVVIALHQLLGGVAATPKATPPPIPPVGRKP